jgi:hypothetical protein
VELGQHRHVLQFRLDFLNLMFSQGGGKGERMRPKKVVRLMRESNFPFAGASRH